MSEIRYTDRNLKENRPLLCVYGVTMIERLTGHLRAAVGQCEHDYRAVGIEREVDPLDGVVVQRFGFKCRYCGDRINVERL